LPKTRIEAFSDGVFAIVITLMAFDIKLGANVGDLRQALHLLLPKLNGYILSFALVGMYWVAHHQMFHVFRRINRVLMWLNLLFLLFVTFLPFTTSLLSVGSLSQLAVIIYGANLAVNSLVLFSMWYYATRIAQLHDSRLTVEVRREVDQRILSMPLLAIASIAISFYNVRFSLFVYYGIILRFLMARRLDRRIEAPENS
jgi:TMEM175 potassium channel family protein